MVRSEHYTFRLILDGDGNTVKTGIHNATNPVNEGEPDAENPTAPKGGVKSMALAVAGGAVKQIAGYAASHVEMFTGSSYRQAQVNDAMTIGKYGAAILASPILGALSFVADGIKASINFEQNKKREQVALNVAMQRAGNAYNQSRS